MAFVHYESPHFRGPSRRVWRVLGLGLAGVLSVAAWGLIARATMAMNAHLLMQVVPAAGVFLLAAVSALLARREEAPLLDGDQGPWGRRGA